MRKIKFSKLNGQGNDFIVIDNTKSHFNFSKDEIKKMCDRNFGIGADGLILVSTSNIADFKMDYYNQDGTIAEMCGNGIRCMSKFIYDNNLCQKDTINIETLAGIKRIFLNFDESGIRDIKVNMGLPDFRPKAIPVSTKNIISKIKRSDKSKNKSEISNSKNGTGKNTQVQAILNYKIKIDSNIFYINCISMGNPHCVIFIDDMNKNQSLSNIPLDKWGPKLENHSIFPKKANVEFVKVEDKNELSMRVWERGVGETLACGTGACAAVACAKKLNKVFSEDVKVNLPGGKLKIIWKDKEPNIFLEGDVESVFNGEYFADI